jgi:hypothetical protein
MSKPETFTAKWIPSLNVTTHAGNPLPQDILFLSQPPKEIGEIISAYSTARNGKTFRRFPLGVILAISIILGLIMNALFGVKPIYNFGWLLWLPLVTLFICFKLEKYIEPFFPMSFDATFIGNQGWARESIDMSSKIQKTQLQFSHACILLNDFSYHYQHGKCNGLHCNLRWFSRGSQEVEKIDEHSWSGNSMPPDGHALHFALAAEQSWTQYIEEGIQTEFQKNGTAVFAIRSPNAKGDFAIRLTAKGITVRYEETNMQLNFTEMEPIKVFHENFGTGKKDECFMIRKKAVEEHKFGKTTLTLPFGEVSNVRVLLDFLGKGIDGKLKAS